MRQVAAAIVIALLTIAASSARAMDCGVLSVGAAYGRPTKLGAFVDGGCGAFGKSSTALVFGGQVGTGGGELSAGVARAAGDLSSVNLRAVASRTWSGSSQTLLGGRVEYSVLAGVLSVNGGVLVPVSGPGRRSAQFTWGVGVGFPVWILSWPGIGRIEV